MVDINTRELTKIVRFMKKHGVLKLKDEGIVIELCQEALRQPDKDEPVNLAAFVDPMVNPATEDEVMYWSAGGSGLRNADGELVSPPLTGEGHG